MQSIGERASEQSLTGNQLHWYYWQQCTRNRLTKPTTNRLVLVQKKSEITTTDQEASVERAVGAVNHAGHGWVHPCHHCHCHRQHCPSDLVECTRQAWNNCQQTFIFLQWVSRVSETSLSKRRLYWYWQTNSQQSKKYTKITRIWWYESNPSLTNWPQIRKAHKNLNEDIVVQLSKRLIIMSVHITVHNTAHNNSDIFPLILQSS